MDSATDDRVFVDAPTVHQWLLDGGEIAFIDIREEGQFGAGHPLLAANIPYSRLEAVIVGIVPRRSARVVLIDAGDGIADRAVRRLRTLGFRHLHVVLGGIAAWQAAGFALFEGVNVPSKAFAEVVEHAFGTPEITPSELVRLVESGTEVAILDDRTAEEFGRFHVPGAVNCPSAELVHRFADFVTSPDAFVVVSCAGRTRGIVGAQTLIHAGVPNRVAALAGGTQGWRLAGLELERDVPARMPPVSQGAAEEGRKRAAAMARRFNVPTADAATIAFWQADPARTTYLFDVRSPEEFAAGHPPGAVSTPGGQLLLALDNWAATRGARLVLIDDTGTRATTTAHWLLQMGWDVHVAEGLLDSSTLVISDSSKPVAIDAPGIVEIEPEEAAQWLDDGAAISVDPSAAYRRAHPSGAVWSTRPRLSQLPADVLTARRIVVFGQVRPVARLAAADLAELTNARIAVSRGGTAAWQSRNLPVESSPALPPDSERIDFLFWNHDRHDGNLESMRAYLAWEGGLPQRIEHDGTAGFKIAKSGSAR